MIVRLHGGLGNQVFQVVAARYLAKTKKEEKISIYTSDLNKFSTKRNFEIEPLLKSEQVINTIDPIDKFCFKYKVSKALGQFNVHSISSVASLTHYKSQYLNGYFQDIYNYKDTATLASVVDELKTDLRSVAKMDQASFNVDTTTSCAIHLRLTDFINHSEGKKFLETYRLPYIAQAIATIKADYNIKNFIVFTDDVVHAKQFLKSEDVQYFNDYEVKDISLLQEFNLLSTFKYLITSNSTYSFWTSVFGPEKVIVFPKMWKHDDKKEDETFKQNIKRYTTLFNTKSEIRIV